MRRARTRRAKPKREREPSLEGKVRRGKDDGAGVVVSQLCGGKRRRR